MKLNSRFALSLIAVLALCLPSLAQTPPTTPTPATLALQVVGYTMSWTDDAGQNYPTAFCLPAQVTLDIIDAKGAVAVYIYKDSTSFAAHKAIVGQHTTQVDTPTFIAGSQQPPQGQTEAQNIAALAIGYMTRIADTDSGTKDANGKPIMRPFFVGGSTTTVNVTLPTAPATP